MKIRRILVAVDGSPHSIAALQAAAVLAAQHGAELAGIFIEDTDLIRLAALPFASEMIYPVALKQPVGSRPMEERLKELAERARHALSEGALRAGAHWSFRVRRGSVLPELLAAAEETDLIAVGKASHEERRWRVRLGTTAANLLVRAPQSVLVLQHGELCRGPALLVCDGAPASLKLLPRALESARIFGGSPVVLLRAQDREKAALIKQQIQQDPALKDVRFRRCAHTEVNGLARIAHEEETGIVILLGVPQGVPSEDLPEMLDQIDCPVLVYRSEKEPEYPPT